jgi:hypothetical protein
MASLGPENPRIFRITHVQNVPWILQHGLHCKTSAVVDPNFVAIGMPDLIERRSTRMVPLLPGGCLGDYVPFYFTPYSIMMYNIKTGYNNIIKRANDEIAILVSSIPRLQELSLPFVFTNAHAYMQEAEFFSDPSQLGRVDWELLRSRDFKRDAEDPGRQGRYQAEALVYKHVPVDALLGIACFDAATETTLAAVVARQGLTTPVKVIPEWYF